MKNLYESIVSVTRKLDIEIEVLEKSSTSAILLVKIPQSHLVQDETVWFVVKTVAGPEHPGYCEAEIAQIVVQGLWDHNRRVIEALYKSIEHADLSCER